MKRFYISIVIVIMALGFCVLGSITVSRIVDDINTDVFALQKAAKEEDYETAKEYSRALEEKWKKYQNYLIVFVNMSRIDKLSERVSSVGEYCTKESKDHLNATLSEMEFLILDIKDAEMFSLFSFL